MYLTLFLTLRIFEIINRKMIKVKKYIQIPIRLKTEYMPIFEK